MTPKSGNPTGPGGQKPRPDAAQGLAFGRPRQGNRKAERPAASPARARKARGSPAPPGPTSPPPRRKPGLFHKRLGGKSDLRPGGRRPTGSPGGGPRSPTRGTPGTALEQGAPDAAKPARGKAAPLLGQQFAQRNRPPRGTVVPLCRCSHGRGQNAPSVLRATESLAGFD